MKVTWLGQGGFLFEHNETKIIVDPYLSDSCEKVNPKLKRRFPVDKKFLEICPDILILTHNHLDHTDPETLEIYLNKGKPVTVLASGNAWTTVRKFGGEHNYVTFNEGTEFTVSGITFKAIYAEHSDDYAIGVLFGIEGKNYYVTGDTLYNKKILNQLPEDIYAVFLPINGRGNNMNGYDAKRFAKETKAEKAVPYHFSLFDSINAKEEFDFKKAVIPTPFNEIDI